MTTKAEEALNHTETTKAPEDYFYDFNQKHHIFNVTFAIINSLITFFGLIGNGLVIWVICFKMKKTVNAVWFLNLAAADFLFLLFLPFHITGQALDNWPFGIFVCNVTRTIARLNVFASVFILMVISVDRCVSVVWPVWSQNRRTVRKASCVSVCVWLLALTLSILRTISGMDVGASSLCVVGFPGLGIVAIIFPLIRFFIPLVIIIFCYAVMIHLLRKNPTFARKFTRTIKKITVIIGAFFLCWGPDNIVRVIWIVAPMTNMFSESMYYNLDLTSIIADSLGFLNSCLNPMLYVFLSTNFRNKACGSIINVIKSALTG